MSIKHLFDREQVDQATQRTIDGIDWEFVYHFEDYVQDLLQNHRQDQTIINPLDPATAEKIIMIAFAQARNNASSLPPESSLRDWIEDFINDEYTAHQQSAYSALSDEEYIKQARKELEQEIEWALIALCKQGQSKFQAHWTLVRFFKSVRQEYGAHLLTGDAGEQQIEKYQQALAQILYPPAKILPYPKPDKDS